MSQNSEIADPGVLAARRFDALLFDWGGETLCKFHESIDKEFGKARDSLEALAARVTPDEAEEHDFGGYYEQKVYDLTLLERSMLGGLAVAVSSHVESCFNLLCRLCKVTGVLSQPQTCNSCNHSPPKPDWGKKRQSLENVGLSADINSLPGFKSAKVVRLLANAFKHNDGVLTERDADKLNKASGTNDFKEGEIEFENQDWTSLIDDAALFCRLLYEIAKPRFQTSRKTKGTN